MNSELPRTADNRPVVQTLDRAPECILLVDPEGVIEVANKAALALLGTAEADLCGSRLVSWFSGEDRSKLEKAMVRVLSDEPGSRLEEVSAFFSGRPGGGSNLSLARMRHRDSVCVVITPAAGTGDVPRRGAAMPKVNETEFAPSPPVAAPPAVAAQPEETANSISGRSGRAEPAQRLMPWSVARARPATARLQPVSEHPVSPKPSAHAEADAHGDAASLHADRISNSETAGQRQPQEADSANAHGDEMAAQSSGAPASAVLRRDIYAEFESERDRQERQSGVPLIAPGKCLRTALQRHRDEAVAESITLTTAIDDGERMVPVDEEMLTALFSDLVERLVAVSPPYCDAEVRLEPASQNGFRALFTDIGRGMSESELEAVFKQPELTMGISHTCLVRAQEAASKLGLKFTIRTAVESGTTAEVCWDD
ncbi:PAS domain-containing protein [Martelella mangrovi]|uniref:PAS domain-containing protein n=1 Tax=Martelella mangrovi TaxID=1397477 RepID=A0ABV2IAI6_9HYPH